MEDVKPRVKKDVKKRMDQFCLDNDLNSFSQGVDLALRDSDTLSKVTDLCKRLGGDPLCMSRFLKELNDLLGTSIEAEEF